MVDDLVEFYVVKGVVFRTQNKVSQNLFCPKYFQKSVQRVGIQRKVDDMNPFLGENLYRGIYSVCFSCPQRSSCRLRHGMNTFLKQLPIITIGSIFLLVALGFIEYSEIKSVHFSRGENNKDIPKKKRIKHFILFGLDIFKYLLFN